ncbi:hypothetical protein ID866_3765 [Astraeus odoratus]|nr:hypothetical protein ID866_3765 [Astraeus odoratus]
MEKFSAFRDPGTGIQPFLPLVPPAENDPFTTLLLPVRGVLAILRIPIFIITTLLYCLLHYSLFVILVSFDSTKTNRKSQESPWRPRAGDIIVSNWTSWIDVLWIAYR